MKAKSIKGKSPEEIQQALQQAMVDGFLPTLAIVFISIKQDRDRICVILNNEGIDIIGATSCGEFITGYQSQGEIAIMLLDIKKTDYAILFEDIGDRDLNAIATDLAEVALQTFKKPALIVCSTGVSVKGEIFGGNILLRNLEKVLGKDVKVYGGMAGDDSTFTGSHVFTNHRSSDYGIAALVLDEDKIGLYGMAISGWKPLGTVKTVTKSEDGWVCTIDDQPALEMYLKYLGMQTKNEDEKLKIFQDIGLFYPLQVEEGDDPVMRTPIMIEENRNAIRFDFPIQSGTKFRFSMPPDFEIVENILLEAQLLQQTINDKADALLIFSCAGRLSALGPMTNMENEGLTDIWKAPMAGFFTYGEYGTTNGKQRFHSTTNSWVALKEK
jgi:hypothetical protein